MNKFNGKFAVFILFLILVIIAGFVLRTPNNMKVPIDSETPINTETSIDSETPVKEKQVAGLLIEFEEGTTEQQVKTILENTNMPANYSIDYNTDISIGRYYVKVDKNKKEEVIDELKKSENWTDPTFPFDIEKGSYDIIVSSPGFENENYLQIMKKNNLEVKKTIVCYINFGNKPENWIPESEANRIKGELETNEEVVIVNFDYIVG